MLTKIKLNLNLKERKQKTRKLQAINKQSEEGENAKKKRRGVETKKERAPVGL